MNRALRLGEPTGGDSYLGRRQPRLKVESSGRRSLGLLYAQSTKILRLSLVGYRDDTHQRHIGGCWMSNTAGGRRLFFAVKV